MDQETITLTAIIEKREVAELTSFSGSNAICGDIVTFTAAAKNIGTVPLSNAKVVIRLSSPDGKDSVSATSDDISLYPDDSQTYEVKCPIPASWPPGSAVAHAGVRNMVTQKWLSRLATTYVALLQPPIHKVKLSIYQPSQEVGRGGVASYIVYLKNSGNRRDDIEIDWDVSQVPKSWKVTMYDRDVEKLPPFTITLEEGATRKLVVEVRPPSRALAGLPVPIKVKARPVPG